MTYQFDTQVGYSGYLSDTRAYAAIVGTSHLILDGRNAAYGGSYSFGEFWVARSGAEGTLVLDQGVSVTVDLAADDFAPDIDVGATGDEALSSRGTLAVLGGSVLSLEVATDLDADGLFPAGYESIRIGAGLGGTGTALVSGEGSLIESSGAPARIRVGRDGGEGTLTVEQGGEIRVTSLEAGRGEETSTGRVVVDGTNGGARIAVGSDYGSYAGGAYDGFAGNINIGRGSGGAGALEIVGGGELILQNLAGYSADPFFRIARDVGSSGTLLVSGSNGDGASRLTVQQNGPSGGEGQVSYGSNRATAMIGEGGVATVDVTDGGQIGVLGQGATLIVSNGRGGEIGGQSALTVSDGGLLLVDSGAYANAQVIVGRNEGSDGVLTVTGEGSSVVVRSDDLVTNDYQTGRLSVGERGTGTLIVDDMATVSARRLLVGYSRTEDGEGTVTSAGSGTVTVSGGAMIEVLGYSATPYQGVRIAVDQQTSGTVTITGEGSRLVSGNADAAAGEIGAGQFRLGRGEGADGTLAVEDGGYAGGFWFEAGRDGGTGTVRVDGGTLMLSDANGRFRDYQGPGEFGDFREIGAQLTLGRDGGTGVLEVAGGGRVEIVAEPAIDGAATIEPNLLLGSGEGSTGTAAISGVGTVVRLAQGARAEDASDGGSVVNLGRNGGQGVLTVSDGAAVNLYGAETFVAVGRGGVAEGDTPTSTLTVDSGGSLSLTTQGGSSGAFLVFGRDAGGSGEGLIDGGTVTLSTMLDPDAVATGYGSILQVGREGSGALTVTNGGQVLLEGNDTRYPGIQIARGDDEGTAPAEGALTVTGEGSSILVTGENDSIPYGRGFLDIATNAGTTGRLEIADGGRVGLPDTASGTTVAEVPTATGEILVTGAASRLDAGAVLAVGIGFGGEETDPPEDRFVFDMGGDGRLTVSDGATVTAGALAVGTAGVVDIDGTLALGGGEGGSDIAGTVAIGERGVGTATVDGDLTLRETAVLELTVTGAGADMLTVTGDATVGLGQIDLLDRGMAEIGEEGILLATAAGGFDEGRMAAGQRSLLLDLVAEGGELRVVAGDSVSVTQAQTVALLFEAAFDRDGEIDIGGVNFWIDAREGVVGPEALTERALSQAFLQAPEFEAIYGPVDDLADTEFVGILYENILDREGEQAGIDFWTGRLEDGEGRDSVLLAFARSAENVEGSPVVQTLSEGEDGVWDFVTG